jgi:predicted nucleotidyltransferase
MSLCSLPTHLLLQSDQMASLNAASQEVNLARSSAKQLRLDLLAVQRSRILTQGRIRAQEKGWREGRAKVEVSTNASIRSFEADASGRL